MASRYPNSKTDSLKPLFSNAVGSKLTFKAKKQFKNSNVSF